MEELEEMIQLGVPRVPLHKAKESSEIRRSEVFCSKIIHQRSTHQIRFRRQPLFLLLVQHSHPEVTVPSPTGVYPRPLSSPFPCFQCHRAFSGVPIFIPTEMLDRRIEEYGNFCSAPCANTYLDKNMRDSNLSTRAADLFEYMQDIHGFRGTSIGFAPHFTQHVNYGGDLTDEQFDAVIGTPGLSTHILMKPYIPTEAVIEWQFAGEPAPVVAPPTKRQPTVPLFGKAMLHPGPVTGGVCKHDGDVSTAAAPSDQACFEMPTGSGSGSGSGSSSSDFLASVMRAKAPEVDHHHRWDATNLRQPPMEEIEERLATLPQLAKTTGLYELYLARKGGFDTPISDDEDQPGGTASRNGITRPRKKNLPSVTPAPPPAPTATSLSLAALLTSTGSCDSSGAAGERAKKKRKAGTKLNVGV